MARRSLRFLAALVLAFVTASMAAFAAGASGIESTPEPVPPKPDFSSIKFLLGSWTCSTLSSRRPGPYTTTVTGSMDSTGYWLIQKDVLHHTSWFLEDVHGTDMTTYDSDSHRWVDVYTDDQGGYNVSTSPGWRGNTAVWTDAVITTVGNVVSTNPTTITKVSDTKTTALNTFKEKSGRVISVKTTCTKAASM